MAISAISPSPQFQQAAQATSLHRSGRSQSPSVSDVDAQSSSTKAPSTGRAGKKLDVTA